MDKLLIATRNPGKFREIFLFFRDLPVHVISLIDIDPSGKWIFEETGTTYEENALLKARYFFDLFRIPVVADDSGIEVEALRGEMGVKTRRWGKGEQASDEEWIAYFLERMKDFPYGRMAKFVCAAAYKDASQEKVFCAEVLGEITHQLEAPIIPGLPLSSCFRPEGFDRVYAALSPEEKSRISHRGLAMGELKAFLTYTVFPACPAGRQT